MVFLTMKYIHIIVPAVLAVFLSISLKRAAAQPVCSSPYIDNPQNRKLCLTLANFFGLPNSLETYSDDMRPSYGCDFEPLTHQKQTPLRRISFHKVLHPLTAFLTLSSLLVGTRHPRLPPQQIAVGSDKIPVGYKGRIPSPDFIENMPGTKRQDVDHVFLRFGRRR
ncbi:hypothetical protein RUM44_012738 [Polyplax serrata]|uniref:Uncharacterized protein n=1 Tax=Polyplax serrata TaxID=468196 RepID=A0ABR1BFY5_POLSC